MDSGNYLPSEDHLLVFDPTIKNEVLGITYLLLFAVQLSTELRKV